jgi:CRISPR-associated protein Csx3
MTTYNINARQSEINHIITILDVGFGLPATNQEIVRDAYNNRINEMIKCNVIDSNVVLINGPISTPVLGCITTQLKSIVPAIGIFDPKLQGYVIYYSVNNVYSVGDLIDKNEV